MDSQILVPLNAKNDMKRITDFLSPGVQFRLKYTCTLFFERIAVRKVSKAEMRATDSHVCLLSDTDAHVGTSWRWPCVPTVCDTLHYEHAQLEHALNAEPLVVAKELQIATLHKSLLPLLNPGLKVVDVQRNNAVPLSKVFARLRDVVVLQFRLGKRPDPHHGFLAFCQWLQHTATKIQLVRIWVTYTAVKPILKTLDKLMLALEAVPQLELIFGFHPLSGSFDTFLLRIEQATLKQFGGAMKAEVNYTPTAIMLTLKRK